MKIFSDKINKLIVIFLLFSFIASPIKVFAQTASGKGNVTYFGTIIMNTIECTRTNNTLVTMYDLSKKQVYNVLYSRLQTDLRKEYKIQSGIYLLGSFVKSANDCEVWIYNQCVELHSDGELCSRADVMSNKCSPTGTSGSPMGASFISKLILAIGGVSFAASLFGDSKGKYKNKKSFQKKTNHKKIDQKSEENNRQNPINATSSNATSTNATSTNSTSTNATSSGSTTTTSFLGPINWLF